MRINSTKLRAGATTLHKVLLSSKVVLLLFVLISSFSLQAQKKNQTLSNEEKIISKTLARRSCLEPEITLASNTAFVCSSNYPQIIVFSYSDPVNDPSLYSVYWDLSPVNNLSSISNATLFSNQIAIEISAGTDPGIYSGNIIVSTDSGCSSYNIPFTVTVNAIPILGNDTSITICSNNQVNLNSIFSNSSFPITWTINGNAVNDPTHITQAGTYEAITINNEGCADTAFVNVNVTNLPSANIIYPSFLCSNNNPTNVFLTGTTGGIFSSSGGLNIDNSTGTIVPSTSTPGNYTIRYTIPANDGCPEIFTQASISITQIPTAFIDYVPSIACTNASNINVIRTGATNGTFSSTAGLNINTLTGTINVPTSAQGNYVVYYTIPASQGCAALTVNTNFSIITGPNASISYPAGTICKGQTNIPVSLTGTTEGVFSSSAGISINANTGAVNPSLSTPGTYTIYYNLPAGGGCPAFQTSTTITITNQLIGAISYTTPVCSNSSNINPIITGSNTGSFSSTSGLSINSSTGLINVSASTAGNYIISYTLAGGGGCPNYISTANFTITKAPAATINTLPLSVCSNTTTTVNVGITGTTGGVFSGTPGLSINAATGVINTTLSTGGPHTIYYDIPAQGGCNGIRASATITINKPPTITLQPKDTSVCKFNNVTFFAAATSYPAATTQWQVSTDGGITYTNISGANANSYSIINANSNQDGWYYRIIYTNACGSTISNPLFLIVAAPLNPQDNPVSQTGCAGFGTVTFTASGNGGNGLLGAVWQYSPDGGSTWIDIPSSWQYTYTGNISNSYTFIPQPYQNGYLFRLRFDNGRCTGSYSAIASLTVNPIPIINDPNDILVCSGSSVSAINFSGTATGYTWTNNNTTIGLPASGTGNITSFIPVNTGNTIQTATITVTPIFTGGLPIASCPGTPKTFTITVNPKAAVNAGAAFTICQGSTVALSGSLSGSATSSTWSAPSGTFSNINALNATYTPSITSGSVTLTLTGNDPDGAGPCLASSSTTIVTVNPPATVNAGTSQNVCTGSSISLGGTIGGSATSATWSATSGSFSNANVLNSTYTPAITSGSVLLTLTTNDPTGPCPAVTSTVLINVNTKATANAGAPQTICSGSTINLNGVVGGSATSGTWSAPSGTFSNPNSLTSTYSPTITTGTVTLTLTTNTNSSSVCPQATSTVIISVNPIPVVNITSTNVSCFGGTNGSASASSTGTSLSYSWNTNPVRTGSSQSNLPPGTYTVTVTDGKGCIGTASVIITEPPAITTNITTTNVLCNGGTNGTASVAVTGGTPIYSYSWNTSPAKTTAAATGLTTGTYIVTVTDAKGCTKTATAIISQPTALIATESHTNVLCNSTTTGTITINGTGGTAPYTGTGTYSGLAAGTYNYSVTDANGCTKSISVTLTQPTAISLAETHVNVLCNGGNNGAITINASGGTAPYSGTGTFSNLTAGTYNYVVTDANGCTKSIAVTITQPNPLVGAETHTNVSCNGGSTGSVIITASGGIAPYTGTGTFSNLAAGTYNYTIKDANGCTNIVTATISQPSLLTLATTSINVACYGGNSGSATVTPSGGTPNYTYSWNTTPIQTNATAINLLPGNYSVSVTDSKGCSKSASISITQPTVLSVLESHTNILCNGAATGSITISASGGTQPYTGTGTFTGLTAGTYNYTVTDANGCSKIISATITQTTPLIISQTHIDVSCNGGNNGSATISATGGTAPYSGIGTFTGLAAGDHTFTVTDANDCIQSIVVTIYQPLPLTAIATPSNALCNGGSTGAVNIIASGGTTPYSGTGNFTGLAAGTYFYTVSDAKGCSVSVSAIITQPISLSATAIPTNILCYGQTTGSILVAAAGGTTPYIGTGNFTNLTAGNYSYIVRDNNGCIVNLSAQVRQPTQLLAAGVSTGVGCNGENTGSVTISATGGTPPYIGTGTFSNLAAGSYSYTITDANGCSSIFNAIVSQPAILSLSETHTNVKCNGADDGTVTITASGGTAPYSGTGTISGLTVGSHTFTVSDANGCTQSITVTLTQPSPIIVTETHTNVLCNGAATGSATISASGGTGILSGTGTFSNLAFGPHIYTVTDQNGCEASITVNIIQSTTLRAIAAQTNVTCQGGSNGSVTITASGGNRPYSGTGTFSNLAAGTYTYFVTDGNNCSAFVNVTITEPDSLIETTTVTDVSCFGLNNGSIIVDASGGTAPYTGIGSYSGLAAGNYIYTIIDSKGCNIQVAATVTQPSILSTSFTTTPVTCNGGSNGTVTISASGGTAPYSGTGTFTGLNAGPHSLVVTDNNGCQKTINFTINEPTPLVASALTTNVSCNNGNDGQVIISASGGTAPYSGIGTFSGLNAGTYTYNVTDANGCITSVNFSIGQPTVLTANAVPTNATCFGGSNGSILITASGGTAPYTGTGAFNGLIIDNYVYVVTDSKGCTVNTSATIMQPTQLILNETNTQISCNGGSDGTATITASGGTPPYVGTGTFNNLTLGNHTFLVTDAKGCNQSITVAITQPPILQATATFTNATCFGSADGSITINATGGSAPYSGIGNFTGLAAGNYLYTVTDANNCSTTINATIDQPALLTANYSVTNVSCYGGSNGSVIITASGGTAPYSGIGTFSGLNAGQYIYTITDAKGCSVTINVTVSQPAILSASAIGNNVLCNGGNSGSIFISASGGTQPYFGTGNYNNLNAGNYSYIITDSKGCSTTATTSITEPSLLILNETHTQILCNGGADGTAIINAFGGTTPYTGTGTFNNLSLGTHNFIVTDAQGCSQAITVDITQPSLLQLTSTHTNATCFGATDGTVTINATGGTAPYTGIGTFTSLGAGSYSYSVTDAAGCIAVISVSIGEASLLNALANTTNVSCYGGSNGSVTISASGGTAPYSGTGTFTGLSAGNYNYTVTDANGCASQIIVTVSEPTLLIANSIQTSVLCNGTATGFANITATGGTSPYVGTGIYSGLMAGTYNFNISDQNGCLASTSLTIAEPTPLLIHESHTQILCNGGADGTTTISASDGTAPYTGTGLFTNLTLGDHTFIVSDANGCTNSITVNIGQATLLVASETHTNVSCNGGNNGTATIIATGGTSPYSGTGTFTGLAAGSYSYTVTDAAGCTSIVIVTINEPSTLILNEVHSNISCNGSHDGSVTITAAGGTAPYSGTGTFTGLSTGSYSYNVTDANGCIAQVVVTISEPTTLDATATVINAFCNGTSTGSIIVTATGGTTPYTGTEIYSGLPTGTYNYIVTDANGCATNISATINEPAPLILSETNTEILCNGGADGTATISAIGGTAPYSGTGLFTNLTLGSHNFIVTDANGCSNSITVIIDQASLLLASETHTNVSCNGGSNGIATIIATGGTAPYTGTGTITGLSAGIYNYTVTDANACSSTINVTITEPTTLSLSETHTNVLCFGGVSGSVSITATGGTAPYTGIGTFTGLAAGTYNYTVTDAKGCSAQISVTISESTLLSASSSVNNTLCNGTPTGSVTISATGGVAPYTGTGTFTGLTAGTYNYIVTDANGCTTSVSATISEPSALILSQTNTQILCNGGANGTATISASGGIAPYTGTGLFINLPFGLNTFIVNDANGCTAQIIVNITQATTLVAAATNTNVSCFGGNNATAIITAIGGTAPYTGTGNYTGLTAGNYNYTVTDAAGCASLTSVTITQPNTLTLSETHNDVLCNGGSSGSITITAAGGTAPYTGIGTFIGLAAGTYNYTVTDANGCAAQISVSISEPTLLTASSSANNALCNGTPTGTVTISATGGVAPYTGVGTFTGLTAGTYNYIVTDANGCASSTSAIISEPTTLILSQTSTQILCNGGATGTATISATGGTAPYTGTGIFTNLTLGPHDFIVVDANGCSDLITVNITQATTLVAAATNTNVSCFGGNNATATITAIGGTAPYTGTGTFTGLAAGNYNYTVTDAVGCASLTSITITQPNTLTLSETHNDVLCNGGSSGSITITAAGGTAPYTGIGTFTGLAAGTYNYVVTDANGCAAQISVTISEPTLLSASSSINNALCNGAPTGNATIFATGGTTPYSGTGNYTGLAAGTYNYIVTDANGCTTSVSAIISEPTSLILSEIHTQIPCNGGATGTATISATGGTAPYTGTGLFNNLPFGINTFIVTDANGCTKAINVNINQATTLQANEAHTNINCFGGSDGTITISAIGGTAPYAGTGSFTGLSVGTYNYTVTDAAGCASLTSVTIAQPNALTISETHNDVLCNGGSSGSITITAVGGTNPYSGTGTFTGLGAGSHSYTITDAAGCVSIKNIILTEPSQLLASESHTNPQCINPSSGIITLTANGGLPPYQGTGVYNNLSQGDYNYTIYDANNCNTSISIRLNTPNGVNLIITNPPSSCGNNLVDITNSSITAGSDTGLSFTYWADANATIPLNNPNGINTSGTYYIEATNSSGCFIIKPVQVVINPAPTATLSGSGTICAGNNYNLVVTLTGTAPFNFSYWDGTSTQLVSGINNNIYQINVTPSATTIYNLLTVNDANCNGNVNTGSATITVTTSVAGIKYPTVTTFANEPTPLTVRNMGSSYLYDWNPRMGLNSYTSINPIFTFDRDMEYLITISNGSGCDIVDTLDVIIEQKNNEPQSGIWVPKAWTPNGSGKNDVLRPLCLNITEIKFFRVFNRWGQLMFETKTIGSGWDGMWNGKPQVQDVFTWTLEAYGIEGKKYLKSGNSILLR